MTNGHGLRYFARNSKREKAATLVGLLATCYLISISSSFVSPKQVPLLGLFFADIWSQDGLLFCFSIIEGV
jgi:hypothetical protein